MPRSTTRFPVSTYRALACLIAISITFSAQAQQNPNGAPGFRSDGVYDFSGIDNVSLFNGALSLTLPLGIEYPAGGSFSYRLSLRYSSSPWDSHSYSSPCTADCPIEFQPKQTHNAGLGWRLALPELIAEDNFWNQTQAWSYVSADGGEHLFYPTLHPSDDEDVGDSGFDQLVEYSRDGSYLRLQRPSLNAGTTTVELPNGNIHSFNKIGGEWRLNRMADRFGNGLDVIYGIDGESNITWTLNDGHRSQVVTFVDSGASFPNQRLLISKIELAAFGDRTATYRFTYATKTVDRPPAHNHPTLDRTLDVKVLHRIDLPSDSAFEAAHLLVDPQAYVMGTINAPAYQADGMLTQMRLPTLGYLEWDWLRFDYPKFRSKAPNQNQDEIVEPFNSVMGVSKKRQKGINSNVLGEWTYSRVLNASDPTHPTNPTLPEKLTVTVKRPLGDKSEHYFSVYPAKDLVGQPAPRWGTRWNEYSLPYTRSESDPLGGDRYLSSKVFDCSANGSGCEAVRSVYVSYELDTNSNFNDGTGILFNKNRRLASQRTLDHYTVNGSDQTDFRLEIYSDFDGLGHHRRSTITSNFGPQRIRVTNFNANRGTYPGSFDQMSKNTAWLTNLRNFQTVQEGGKVAKQEFCFNESNGSLERTRAFKLSTGVRSANDLIQSFSYDADGHVDAQTWYGSDTGSVGVGDLCNINLGMSTFRIANTYQYGVLKTSRYTQDDGSTSGALGFYNTNHTSIDRNTSSIATTKNAAGLSTSYAFDILGRLRLISPNAASGVAAQKIFYTNATSSSNPARVEVRELANGSADNGDTLTEKHYRYDGLGRLARERVRLPSGGLSDKYHYYDSESRQTSSSTWGGAAFGTTSAGFDPFGRPTIIYPPDANPGDDDHAIRLSYEGFRKTRRTANIGTAVVGGTVTETAVSRTEEYDAWGRLIAVTESSGADGSDVTTTYEYELGDRLTKATTPLGGGLNQVRTWSYDQRGFLNSECHPEKGTNGNGCTFYSQYDPMGKARQVIDGPFTRKYAYDRASRLTAVRDASNRVLKTFAYGSASTTGNWAEGQLIQASNHQYPDLGNGPIETRFVEDFTFGGIGGARSKRKVSWLLECQNAFGFTQGDCEPGELVTREVFEHSETLDATGKRRSVQYPVCVEREDGCGPTQPRTINTTYHPSTGFMTGVTGWASSISYHSNMTMSQIQHSNGITDVFRHDPHAMARPASMHAEDSSGDVLWETGTFRFDGAGNLIEQNADAYTDHFIYDGVSRLVTSSQWIPGSTGIFSDGFETGDLSAWGLSDIPANEYSEQIFVYDIAGNLTKITTDGTPRIHAISATTNRLTGNGFTYDSAGNLTRFPSDDGVAVQHDYDAFNRLSKRTHGDHVTRYFYTADDERIMRFGTEGFSWTLRDFGGQLLREFKPDVAIGMVPQRDHIYRGGSLIDIVTPNASGQLTVKHHYSLDHLGSPRLITDAAGQVEAEHKYYPFGEEATLSSQDRHPMKFTGHERDFNEAGEGDDLDYMHARHCDPRKGRFLSVDPVRGSPGSPQSWNGYAYVRGNPMMYTDPTGEITKREGASLVVSFIPVIGDAKDAQEVVTGVDLISGEKLSTTERVVTVAAALVPIVSGVLIRKALKAATDVPRGTDDTFEILDGVRRSKSAEFAQNSTIPAKVFDAEGRLIGAQNLPINSLRSPKSAIDISTDGAKDRFFNNNLRPAMDGSVPPPIEVTPGSRGTLIQNVKLDPIGDQM